MSASSNANPGRIFSQPAGGGSFYSLARVDDDRWHHITFVYNGAAGGTDRFYVDGLASGAITHANAWSWPATQIIELGLSHDTYWQKYNGLLDEVRFYNTALTPTQISQIFNGADESVDPADLNLNLSASLPGNPGAFLRIPFSISNPAAINTLRFTARTSDGFTAWLNGTRITSLNSPADPLWNSAASSTSIPTRSSITDFPAASLVSGTNILAIQSLNNSPTDPNSLAAASLDALSIDPAGAYPHQHRPVRHRCPLPRHPRTP